MLSFRDQIAALPDGPDALPLTHIADVEGFFRAVTDGKITQRTLCQVFNENLVYTFYGRPSYRLNAGGDEAFNSQSYAPVCFILDQDATPPKRVFPFDSGGFSFYAQHLHRDHNLQTYEMDPSISNAQKLVGKFYGSNQAYLDMFPIQGLTFSPLETTLSNYYGLIASQAQGSDERHSSVEIQFDAPFDLMGKILAVVLPSAIADDATIQKSLASWNAIPLPYKIRGRFRPIEFVSKFYELIETFLSNRGLL